MESEYYDFKFVGVIDGVPTYSCKKMASIREIEINFTISGDGSLEQKNWNNDLH